ncbi:MAG: hypothetical protein WBZ04_05145 [Candidatus Nanopelagicales bacterium]|jgi:hypothetical protein
MGHEQVIAPSAYRHGLDEQEILHAYRNAVVAHGPDDEGLIMLVGPTVMTVEKLGAARAMRAGGVTFTVIASALEIGRSTVRRTLVKST